jgi:hypothetical protein
MDEKDRDTPRQNQLDVVRILGDLTYIRKQIDALLSCSDEHDNRLTHVERVTWAGASLVGLISAIFIPIAVAAIKKWLGL